MHEVGVMSEAVRMAVESANANGGKRVLGIRLRVGVLSGVVPEALQFAFDMVCQGTIAEGAKLEIETLPAVFWCRACDAEFECKDFMSECPGCHGLGGELRRGREMDIASVEID